MKYRFGAARAVPPLDQDQLESLPTKGLLLRLTRLRECEESRDGSDMTDEEAAAAAGILFKEEPAWQDAYEAVKAVLSTREHVPGPAERRQMRQERAKRDRSSERIGRRR